MQGIKFNDIHSYRDLNLVLAPFQMPPATPKTNFIDVPGADGSIDASESLGEIKFNDRTGNFVFSVLPEDDFEEKKTQISNLLNGLKCKITLDKDPGFYYLGRLMVKDYKANKMLRQITIDFRVQPYKFKKNVTTVEVAPKTPKTPQTVILKNNRMSVVPTITTTKDTTIVFGNATLEMNAGTHKFLDIYLKYGDNPITVESEGVVTITYQEGAL